MNRTTTRWARIRVVVLALAVAASMRATPAAAQDGLIVGNVFVSASRDPGARLGAASPDLSRPLAGGGRYAVRDADVVDLRTGRIIPLPIGAAPLVPDPARPRVFLRMNCGLLTGLCDAVVWHLDTGDLRRLTTVSSRSDPFFPGASARYAVDADVLFVDQDTAPPPAARSVLPVSVATGQPVGPAVAIARGSWDVLPDASRLFAGPAFFGTSRLVALDVASGQVVASFSGFVGFDNRWDDALQALVSVGGGVQLFDANVALIDGAPLGGACGVELQASPHTGRIYVISGGGDSYIGPVPHRFLVFSPTEGWREFDIDQKAGIAYNACPSMVVLTAPGPPRAFAASAVGHDVSMQWQNVGAASHFVLDVGFAPGRTDLSIPLGPDSHAAFAGVPSGTYYLRLRGGNEFGGGRPSQEVTLVVP